MQSKRQNEAPHVQWSDRIVLEQSPTTDSLATSGYGTPRAHGALALTSLEAAYLHEKGTICITDLRSRTLTLEQIERRATKRDPEFWIRLVVFTDLRNRGYVVKTALKYGADFRVYEKGVKPGQDHSKWIVYPVHEGGAFGWREFAAQNRVAHATRKRLLLAIVDDEAGLVYYEVGWTRP